MWMIRLEVEEFNRYGSTTKYVIYNNNSSTTYSTYSETGANFLMNMLNRQGGL